MNAISGLSTPSAVPSTTSALSGNDTSPRHASEQFFSEHAVFLFGIPAAALVAVALITLAVFLLVRRWKHLQRRQQVPVFRYDPSDAEVDADWEADLLEEADPPFVRNSQRSIIRTMAAPSRQPVPGS